MDQSEIKCKRKYKLMNQLKLTKLESITHQIYPSQNSSLIGNAILATISKSYYIIGTTRGQVMLYNRNTQALIASCHIGRNEGGISFIILTPNEDILFVFGTNGFLYKYTFDKLLILEYSGSICSEGYCVTKGIIINTTLIVTDTKGVLTEFSIFHKTKKLYPFQPPNIIDLRVFQNTPIFIGLSCTNAYIVNHISKEVLLSTRISKDSPEYPLLGRIRGAGQNGLLVCIGSCRNFQFYQLLYVAEKNFALKDKYKNLIISKNIEFVINLEWISRREIIAVHADQIIRHWDVDGILLNLIDMYPNFLSTSISFHKGLTGDGLICEDFKAVAKNATYNSLHFLDSSGDDKTIYLLFHDGVFELLRICQYKQVVELVNQNDYKQFLHYAYDVVRGKIIMNDDNERTTEYLHKLIPIMTNKLLQNTSKKGSVTTNENIKLAVDVNARSLNLELLFGPIHQFCEESVELEDVYNDSIRKHFLSNKFIYIPPEIVKQFMGYCVKMHDLKTFVEVLPKIPFDLLDIDYSTKICRRYRLYDGIGYLMNKRANNYLDPFFIMRNAGRRILNKKKCTKEDIETKNTFLLYIDFCLSGRLIVSGEALEEDLATKTFNEIFGVTMLRGNLDLVLRLDAAQFFNVICSIHQTTFFKNNNFEKVYCLVGKVMNAYKSNLLLHQSLPSFLNFIKTMITQITLSLIYDQILEFILFSIRICFEDNKTGYEVERGIAKIMRNMELEEYFKKQVLSISEDRKLYFIQLFIYNESLNYHKMIDCYLNLPEKENVFEVVEKILNVPYKVNAELFQFIKSKLFDFEQINLNKTAHLMLEYFNNELTNASKQLLRVIFKVAKEKNMTTLTGDLMKDELLLFSNFKYIVEKTPANEVKSEDVVLYREISYWKHLIKDCNKYFLVAADNNFARTAIELVNSKIVNLEPIKYMVSLFIENINEDNCRVIFDISATFPQLEKKEKWLVRSFEALMDINASVNGIRLECVEKLLENDENYCDYLTDFMYNKFIKDNLELKEFGDNFCFMANVFDSINRTNKSAIECLEVENRELLDVLLENSVSSYTLKPIKYSCCVKCGLNIETSLYVGRCLHLTHLECMDNKMKACSCTFTPGLRSDHIEPIPYPIPFKFLPQKTFKQVKHTSLFDEDKLKLNTGPNFK